MKSSRAAGVGVNSFRRKNLDFHGPYNKQAIHGSTGDVGFDRKDGLGDNKILHLKFYHAFQDDFNDKDLD